MIRSILRTLTVCLAFGVLASALGLPNSAFGADELRPRTELDDYFEKKDPSFKWSLVGSSKADQFTTLLLQLTSQTWLDKSRVDRPVWKHWVNVVVPKNPKTQVVLLLIGGGSNGKAPPTKPDDQAVLLSQATGSVVAELRMIPNQPLVFDGDGKQRVEDGLISYAWVRSMKTGDPEWLPQLPMAKSVIRAMDTITEAVKKHAGHSLDRFVLTGGSKRGWTTWLAGIDKRVVAIAPIVIDVLNVQTSMEHHFGAYGFWSPAVGDYVRNGVIDWHGTPEYTKLLSIVDPFAYRHRLNKPKFIVNASGDEFFLPDSSQFYFDKLQGEKYLRYVPNGNHSLRGTDALESLSAWFLSVATDTPRPKFEWKHVGDNGFKVIPKTKPKKVLLWSAKTRPDSRDFRLETIGKAWESREMTASADGSFDVSVETPDKGWRGFFVELSFDAPGSAPLKFTTDVRVVPNVLPHQDKLRAFLEKSAGRNK